MTISYSWRWWTGIYAMYRRPPVHRRPHIGRRRARRVWVEFAEWAGYERRSAAGRPLAFQKPPYQLHLETVVSGPYEEPYAGYRATWWYQRRLMRDRERRGWPREKQYRNLYRPHPLQGGKT
jgi:hypothetical protein